MMPFGTGCRLRILHLLFPGLKAHNFYRHQLLPHWVHSQEGLLQGDHSQQAGLVFVCKYHWSLEGQALEPDDCLAYVHRDGAAVGQPGLD